MHLQRPPGLGRHLISPRLKSYICPIAFSSLLAFVLYSTAFHLLLPTSEPLGNLDSRPQFAGSNSPESLLAKGEYIAGSNLTIWADSNPSISFSPLERQRGQNVEFGQREPSQSRSNRGGRDECGEPPSVPLTILTDLDDPLAGEWPLDLRSTRCA